MCMYLCAGMCVDMCMASDGDVAAKAIQQGDRVRRPHGGGVATVVLRQALCRRRAGRDVPCRHAPDHAGAPCPRSGPLDAGLRPYGTGAQKTPLEIAVRAGCAAAVPSLALCLTFINVYSCASIRRFRLDYVTFCARAAWRSSRSKSTMKTLYLGTAGRVTLTTGSMPSLHRCISLKSKGSALGT